MSDAHPAGARRHRALVLFEQRRYDLAARELRQVAAAEPDDPFARALLALCLAEQEDYADASAEADEAVRLAADPGHTGSLNLRGIALRQLGRGPEAHATVEGALARDPENAVAHANRGWMFLEQRQPERALDAFREALRIEPGLEYARRGVVP